MFSQLLETLTGIFIQKSKSNILKDPEIVYFKYEQVNSRPDSARLIHSWFRNIISWTKTIKSLIFSHLYTDNGFYYLELIKLVDEVSERKLEYTAVIKFEYQDLLLTKSISDCTEINAHAFGFSERERALMSNLYYRYICQLILDDIIVEFKNKRISIEEVYKFFPKIHGLNNYIPEDLGLIIIQYLILENYVEKTQTNSTSYELLFQDYEEERPQNIARLPGIRGRPGIAGIPGRIAPIAPPAPIGPIGPLGPPGPPGPPNPPDPPEDAPNSLNLTLSGPQGHRGRIGHRGRRGPQGHIG